MASRRPLVGLLLLLGAAAVGAQICLSWNDFSQNQPPTCATTTVATDSRRRAAARRVEGEPVFEDDNLEEVEEEDEDPILPRRLVDTTTTDGRRRAAGAATTTTTTDGRRRAAATTTIVATTTSTTDGRRRSPATTTTTSTTTSTTSESGSRRRAAQTTTSTATTTTTTTTTSTTEGGSRRRSPATVATTAETTSFDASRRRAAVGTTAAPTPAPTPAPTATTRAATAVTTRGSGLTVSCPPPSPIYGATCPGPLMPGQTCSAYTQATTCMSFQRLDYRCPQDNTDAYNAFTLTTNVIAGDVISCKVCGITRPIDTDGRRARFKGTLGFGPNSVSGTVLETVGSNRVRSYKVYAATACGEKLGDALATVSAFGVSARNCCDPTYYQVFLDITLPLGFNRFLVLPTTSDDGELPFGALTDTVYDFVNTSVANAARPQHRLAGVSAMCAAGAALACASTGV